MTLAIALIKMTIAILTEGTDIPIVDCILLTRPTQSTTLFQQMFGRGLRLFPGKEDCLVIDFEDNFTDKGKHSLITIPTLLGLNVSSAVENQDILELEEQAIQHQNAVALQELQTLKEQGKMILIHNEHFLNDHGQKNERQQLWHLIPTV